MNYFIGDIHGNLDKLVSLFKKLIDLITDDDTVIFLGDYIDRGPHSYEVIEYLIALSKRFNTVFLKGNHEDMMENYLLGKDIGGAFLFNGGLATIQSYNKHCGEFKFPENHIEFFSNLKLYFEGEGFIAVHAGLNPDVEENEDQDIYDLLWIRDKFYRSNKRWDKTIIFGHTSTSLISRRDMIYMDEERNIIGIDSGVVFGGPLSCLRWPDKKVFQSD
ncbi:MAG: serine/threonine protein phosphatase [bacterium]|nr:serine/threonine protein phosphatase [bacterium]